MCHARETEARKDPNWLTRHAQFANTSVTSNGSIRAIFFGAFLTNYFPGDIFDTNYGHYGALNYEISVTLSYAVK